MFYHELYFSVSYKFGILAMVSGLLGVPIGSLTAQALRPRYSKIDPIICAVGLITSAPLVYFAILSARSYTVLCYIFVFFGEFFLNLTWSIVADMLLVSNVHSSRFIFQFIIYIWADNNAGWDRWSYFGRIFKSVP